MTRPISEANVLKQQARAIAIIHNYDLVDSKIKHSNQIADKAHEQRQEDVHLHYAQFKDSLIEKHKAQIETSRQVYLKNIEHIEMKHDEATNILQKRLDLRARTLKYTSKKRLDLVL